VQSLLGALRGILPSCTIPAPRTTDTGKHPTHNLPRLPRGDKRLLNISCTKTPGGRAWERRLYFRDGLGSPSYEKTRNDSSALVGRPSQAVGISATGWEPCTTNLLPPWPAANAVWTSFRLTNPRARHRMAAGGPSHANATIPNTDDHD